MNVRRRLFACLLAAPLLLPHALAAGGFAILNAPNAGAVASPEGSLAAGTQQIHFESVTSFGCASGATIFELTVSGFADSPAYNDAIVNSGGEIYSDQLLLQTAADQTGIWVWGNSNDRGLQTQVYPIPPGQPVRHTILVRAQPESEPTWKLSVVLDGCDTGNVVSVEEGPLVTQAIPTASGLGLAALAGLLLLAGFWLLRHRSLASR